MKIPVSYLSVCAGIEAASCAWHSLGWKPLAFCEIEAFPSAVLKHHFPTVPNLGDMTLFGEWSQAQIDLAAVDALVGGTPCQAFSYAGLRKSLEDLRGNLTLTYVELLNYIDEKRNAAGRPPAICLWENVPGVLNTDDNAFGCFLGGLAGSGGALESPDAGGGWANAGYVRGPKRAVAWRVLDAQYFGVAQRRTRLFVVASAREGFDPAAVLFESEGVRRDSAPVRQAGQEVVPTIRAGAPSGGPGHGAGSGDSKDELIVPVIADCLQARDAKGPDTKTKAGHLIPEICGAMTARFGKWAMGAPEVDGNYFLPGVAHTLRGEGHDASEDGTDRGVPLVPMAFDWKSGGDCRGLDVKPTAMLQRNQVPAVMETRVAVRRLTPLECSRLQGFPDYWTQIPYRRRPAELCKDGPRYKALGNSMAVPCMAWLGARIDRELNRKKI